MFGFASFCLLSLVSAQEPTAISLQDFLTEVREKNRAIQVSSLRRQSNELARAEPQLVFSPYGRATLAYNDNKPTALSSAALFTPDQTKSVIQSYGLSKKWTWGMATSITHHFNYNSAAGLTPTQPNYWSNGLEVSVTQSLWKNFLGRGDRWNLHSAENRLDAAALMEEFRIQQILAQAEVAYWNYALSQALRKSFEGSLARTQRTLSWNEKRREANLVDRGDVLQSRAAVLKAKDSLIEAKKNETKARRMLMFFLAESIGSNPESFNTQALPYDATTELETEAWQVENRLDLQAKQKTSLAAEWEAQSQKDAGRPDLNLFASYGGKSLAGSFGTAESETLDNSYREYEIGVSLEIPLNFWKTNDVKRAKDLFARSQNIDYRDASEDTAKYLKDLLSDLEALREKILLSEELEKVQKGKLSSEEKKFRQGRSSSFQVISFEEDLASAELNKLQLYAEARSLLAELKLYEKNSEEKQ